MVASAVPLPRLLLLCVALVSLAIAGCRSGVSAGEGPGIKGYAEGELNANVPGSLEAAKAAVEQVLVAMGVQNASEQRNAVLVEINAQTLQAVPLEIKLSAISDDLTKLRVRAGEGDQALARSIYTQVRDRLQLQYR